MTSLGRSKAIGHSGTQRTGNRWLVMTGLSPEKIPPQGIGYWRPGASATVEGARSPYR